MTTSTKLIPIKNVPIKNIDVPKGRMRKLQPDTVKEMVESVKKGALLPPILIRPKPKGSRLLLVIGVHRLEAMKKLKSKTIEARIVTMTDDEALVAELEENIIRAELTKEEREDHTLKLKILYEKAHPGTKQGGASGKAGGGKTKTAKVAGFAEAHGKKCGRSPRSVARDAARAKLRSKIDPQAFADLKEAGLDSDANLKVYAKLSAPEQLKQAAAARAKAGETVTAVKPKTGKPKPKATELATDPTETATATTATGNGNDPDEAAAKMSAAHEANAAAAEAAEAAGESNPEPAPKAADQTQAASKARRASARQLGKFKVACDIRLPKLNVHDLVEAIEYATEVYHRTLRPDAPDTIKADEPADTAAPEVAVQ